MWSIFRKKKEETYEEPVSYRTVIFDDNKVSDEPWICVPSGTPYNFETSRIVYFQNSGSSYRVITGDEWYSYRDVWNSSPFSETPLNRDFFMGNPIYFIDGQRVVVDRCLYCGTKPFMEDKFHPMTCAKCGAPL